MGNVIVSRNNLNQSALKLENVSNYQVYGAGTVSGSGALVGTRNNANNDRTVFEFSQNDEHAALDVFMDDTANEIHANGNNVDMAFKSANVSKDVVWNVQNGNLNLSNSAANNNVTTTKDASNNMITLGSKTDVVNDSGSYNAFLDTGGNNIFNTQRSSTGAVFYGTNGNDTYNINGQFGVFFAGSGNNTINLNGDSGMNDAYRNVVFGGSGTNTVWDRGAYSLFLGGSGLNTVNVNGYYGIATSGTNSASKINMYSGAQMCNGFKNVQQAESNMRIKDWVFSNYMDYSGHQDNSTNSLVYWPLYSVLPK